MNAVMEKAFTGNGTAKVFAEPINKSLGDFAVSIARIKTGSGDREQVEKRLAKVYGSSWQTGDAPKRKTPLSEDSGPVGGYLVPTDIAWSIMKDAAEDSIFLAKGFVQPMTSRTLLLSIPDPTRNNSIPLGSNMFGGMIFNWQSSQLNNAAKGETEPAFSQVEVVAQELTGYLVCSNQLAMDAPGMDAFLKRFVPRGVANQVDQACFRGPGPGGGGPTGLVSAGCTLTATRAGGNDVTQADLSSMYARLMPGSERTAVWGISPTALDRITRLSMPGILIMLPGDDGSTGLLYGKPFFKTEKLPDVGTIGDVLLFDPNCYVIGWRDLLIDFSDQQQDQFVKGQCSWRVVARIGGGPMIKAPVTLASQSATQGAIAVQLSA